MFPTAKECRQIALEKQEEKRKFELNEVADKVKRPLLMQEIAAYYRYWCRRFQYISKMT